MKSWAWKEMKGTTLLHVKARSSLAAVCERLHDAPKTAFSVAAGHAGRQVVQRVSRIKDITSDALLEGHGAQTARRCAEYPYVLVAQDTTTISFTRELPAKGTKGLRQQRVVRQYLGHSALALSPTGVPLGLLHLRFWQRPREAGEDAADPLQSAAQKRQQRRARATSEKESHQWVQGLQDVEARLPPEQPVLLIQDREADVFAFLAAPRRPNTHLLLRVAQARNVVVSATASETAPTGPVTTLAAATAAFPAQGTRTVRVPATEPGKERDATLTLRWGVLWVLPPTQGHRKDPREPQRVWVVLAEETNAPEGETPVGWVLLTTQPVEDQPAAEALLDHYALRWRIERLHYTLKSGLEIERLQHDEVRLPLVLALYYLVAWRIMWCLYLGRHEPERSAAQVLEPDEVRVLSAASRQAVRTASDIVQALARLGGYVPYPKAKPPGLKRIWQGYRRLQEMLAGSRLQLEGENC